MHMSLGKRMRSWKVRRREVRRREVRGNKGGRRREKTGEKDKMMITRGSI